MTETPVGWCKLEHADTLHKVTIVARGMAGGVTQYLPDEEKYVYLDRDFLLDKITMALGGMVAETMIYGRHTSGPRDDIKRVTDLARRMVTQWGMSETLGPVAYGENEETVFLGRSITHTQNFSEETARLIDAEVRRIIENCHDRAREILEANVDVLHKLADALMERETVTGEEVEMLLRGEALPPFDKEAAEAARRQRERESLSTAERIDAVLEEAKRAESAGQAKGAEPEDGGEDPFLGEDAEAEGERKERG